MELDNTYLAWYEPKDVLPNVEQLQSFVLPYLDDLKLGEWPTKPTGYVDKGKSSTRNVASFGTAADLYIEIDYRLGCIVDSIALILFYTSNPTWSIERIAAHLHYDEIDLEHELAYMLFYISGKNRKRRTYPEFKADIRYKNRVRKRS